MKSPLATPPNPFPPFGLLVGDGLTLLAVTLIGNASHDLGAADLRWLATFLPLCLAWGMLAPWLGVFRPEIIRTPRATWRVTLAMSLAAPMAAWLRALLLDTVIQPVFVLILGLSSALALSVWRLLWAFACRQVGEYG